MNHIICKMLIFSIVASSLVYGDEFKASKFLNRIKNSADYLALIYSRASSIRYTDDSCYIFLPSCDLKKIRDFETNSFSHDSMIIKSAVTINNPQTKSTLPEIVISFMFESTNGLMMLHQKRALLVGAGISAPASDKKVFYIKTIEAPKLENEYRRFSSSNKASHNEFSDNGNQEVSKVLTQDEINGYGINQSANLPSGSGDNGFMNSNNSPEIQTFTSSPWPQTPEENRNTNSNQKSTENGSNTIVNNESRN